MTERLAMVVALLFFAGMRVTELLNPLTEEMAVVGLVLLFVLGPVVALVSQFGTAVETDERGGIAFFGIRGIGSPYYLSYALTEARFEQSRALWALVGFVVLVSIVYGILATPVMNVIPGRGDA
jgi:NhaP-type Na+/H+ or K+/H+ antiporter